MCPWEFHDKPRDECGVLGIYAPGNSVSLKAYYGLNALQHRGEESAGIAVSDGKQIRVHKKMGLVAEVFNKDILSALKGNLAIGHVRYSTSGDSSEVNAQPLLYKDDKGSVAVAHNGNITNARQLKKRLAQTRTSGYTNLDSEIFLRLLAYYRNLSLEKLLELFLKEISGSYSLVIMTENSLIGLRDPYGMRPLCLGKLKEMESGYILASETCALRAVGGELVREIDPGEGVIIDKNGVSFMRSFPGRCRRLCIFEYIYLARSDSVIDGRTVNSVRREFGRELAREHPVAGDVVISIPESGTAMAMGYAEQCGLPFREGLLRNRYIGRTFIKPGQKNRELAVKMKFNVISDVIQGQRVVVVDDSLVRGTTSCQIVRMLREAGAKEVHLLVASPPLSSPCYYGIDIPSAAELVAAHRTLEEIRQYVGSDSLQYLSLKGMLQVLRRPKEFCTACFDGVYPVPVFEQETG
ncbi:amidophosphoribosyltransferase [Desulfosporosinus orientis DSM 765]|uniref:Amidophosphoribosyltransferase n=1 Tax=Desulfosporosinus orientis (strain ATCC 19365 / DSM 765 / NCIMB 8382 / VKM B-1628 / Singapore I) TaxID=768706 RepID=G7W8Y6_DESOD|nr:amidophosphoribosyltransferase [Desulfosporosinus orientis]AET68195.1 amidophosphoribosyltransferase [Desulfosporosinus orientis DSM 765]